MSSFLCFLCHNTVHDDTTTETREKYRELVGMKLCPDSHLCHICRHLLNKLCLFKSICLRRSLEYPILFSEKGVLNLQNANIETTIACDCMDECDPKINTAVYHFSTNEDNQNSSQYVSLEDKLDDNMHILSDFKEEEYHQNIKNIEENHSDTDIADKVNHEDSEFDDVDTENPQNNEESSHNVDHDAETTEALANDEAMKDLNSKNDFHKVILSIEEQRAELEAKRREDKYLEAEFKCYNCALGFLFKDTYQAHMMRHEESNGEHLCPVCTLRFASARVLRAHAAAHRERAACARCGLAVRARRLAAHRARCGRPARAACHLCGNTYSDSCGLQQHIKRFHLSKTSRKTYSCNVCGKTYNNQGAVRTHMIKHINKKFTCDQCSSTFSSPYTLAQHRKKHGTTEEHRCETCNVSYKSRKSLLAHIRNSLNHQQTVVTCPVCARVFPHARALAAHASAHGQRALACPQCPARFAARRALAAHARRHAARAQSTAVCHLCGTSFKGNSKLNRHLRSVCEKEKLEEELSAYYNQE